ncbi:NuoF family protein [Parabacteroides sp. FAFU027]|uniref:NuoF family protein n=1 Tax=Parabacteroides sp. FAFU027 TaxID=2922715 RepID=UPI001FAF3AF7|nr:NuoF family protein [Parabacteroides sp. FAFU027]
MNATIYIGSGTCGLGAGAARTEAVIRRFVREHNLTVEIVPVGCVGLCSSEPIIDVKMVGKSRISFERVTEDNVIALLEPLLLHEQLPDSHILGQYRDRRCEHWVNVPYLDQHPFFARQKRIVLQNCGVINPEDIHDYFDKGGYKTLKKVLREKAPDEVCEIVLQSGLRGRGGGGFPTGAKWEMMLAKTDKEKYLVCNADEGDPGAFMDRAVIEGDPHRMLEGMAIAAFATGATKGFVYIRAEYPLATLRLAKAIVQAEAAGALGKNIFGTGFNFDIVIRKGAGAYVCGEETALMSSIEGLRGMPYPRPPFPVEKGIFGKPTVINNVETFANVPDILAHGAEWFSTIGTDKSKGTKVFALSGKVKYTGLVEIPMGTSVREIIYDIGGGTPNGKEFKAVQMGGPSGGCVNKENLDIQVDYDSLLSIGAMMGSGGMVVMDEDTCMVDIAKFFMSFITRESCGKCTPCREGTRQLLHMLEVITSLPCTDSEEEQVYRHSLLEKMERLCRVIKDASLCGLGAAAPNSALSTLRWFRQEYEEHITEFHCRAGVCPLDNKLPQVNNASDSSESPNEPSGNDSDTSE